MKGTAYVFLRKDGAPLPTGPAGHVGWGFSLDDQGHCFCGSTENTTGLPYVAPAGDNAAWFSAADSPEAMIALFRERGYDCYKVSTVRDSHPNEARAVGEMSPNWGYAGLFNNCLDHVHKVLAVYGDLGMPWMQSHPAPNDWFALYNGQYYNL
jgi:hypothetical protein